MLHVGARMWDSAALFRKYNLLKFYKPQELFQFGQKSYGLGNIWEHKVRFPLKFRLHCSGHIFNLRLLC